MPRPSIFLLVIFFLLSVACFAEARYSQPPVIAPPRFLATPSFRHATIAAGKAYRLASSYLGWIEASNAAHDPDKSPKTPAEKIWAVLNSPVGVWALGSVVLALIIKAYSTREARKAESLKLEETRNRLDTEIAFRLAMALDGLRINEARLESSPTTPRGIHQNAYDYLENAFITFSEPNRGRDFSVFPEYKDRTFRALILELRTVVDAHDEADLRQALHAYEQLSEGGDIGSEDSSPKCCHDAFATVRDLLQSQLVRPRWRKRVNFLSGGKKQS